MPSTTLEYPAEPYSSVKRFNARGTYLDHHPAKFKRRVLIKDIGSHELETIHSILNASPILHVSFNTDASPFPMILPMIGFVGSFDRPSADVGDVLDLYLHGYVSSRLMRMSRGTKNSSSGDDSAIESSPSASPASSNNNDDNTTTGGLPISVAASFVDGLVLTTTPNGHVYNYRSAVVFGYASVVDDDEEKQWAMRKTTDSVVPGQWDSLVLPLAKKELASVSVLRVKIKTGSAKIRTGMPSSTPDETIGEDETADNSSTVDGTETTRSHKDVWKGVLPVYQTVGEPISTPNRKGMAVPEHIVDFRRCFNDASKAYATEAAEKPMVAKKKH